MINVAGEFFIQKEKELEESNQLIKNDENYIGDDKIKTNY